jgi:hypothetical protein
VIKYFTSGKFEPLTTVLKKDRHKFSRLVGKKIISEKWNDDKENPFYSIELTDLEQQEVINAVDVEGMAKGGKVLLNYQNELEAMDDDKLKEAYENEFGVDAENRIEDERDDVITELVSHYKTVLKSRGEMAKGGSAGEKMITIYHFFGSYLQDGSLFAPFAILNNHWTTDKSEVEKIFNEAGLNSFKKEDLEEVKPLYRDGVLLFEIQKTQVPELEWKHRISRYKESGYPDENEFINHISDFDWDTIKERAIFIDGEKVSKKELAEYFETYEKGGQIENWITANSDRVAYPRLKTPDGKIWDRHSEYKTRAEAESEMNRLKSGFYKDAKILDLFDGTNQRVYIYVTGHDESFKDNESVHVIRVIENGHPVTLNSFSEKERDETFEDIKKRSLKIISVKSVPFQEWKSKNKKEKGGEAGYGSILEMSKEDRVLAIMNFLDSKEYISRNRGDFYLIAEKTNEFIESYFIYNRDNPLLAKNHKVYFEPLYNKNDLHSQIRYAVHFVTADTADKLQRFYDKSKAGAVNFLLDILSEPDKVMRQVSNNRIIYIRKINVGKNCCIVLSAELNSDGDVIAVSIMPDQSDGRIKQKEAKNLWINASFPSRSTPKSSSGETVSDANDDIDSTSTYNKDNKNIDSDNEAGIKLLFGGKTVVFGAFYDKNDNIVGIAEVSGGQFNYDSFILEPVPVGFYAEEISGLEYDSLKEDNMFEKGGNVPMGSMTLLEDSPVNINFSKGTFSESGLSKEQVKFLKHIENLWLEDKLNQKTKMSALEKYKHSGRGEEILDALQYWESLNKPLDKKSAFHPSYLSDYLVGGGDYYLQINVGGEFNSRNVRITPKLERILKETTLLYPLAPKEYFFKISQRGDLYIVYQKIIGDRMIASNVIIDYKRGGDTSPKAHSDINWLITG